jgi:hypothetical protein
MDSHTQTVLQDILRRESRSALLYADEAYPWTTVSEEKALASLRQIIAAERDAVTRLGQFLVRQRIPLPYLPPFPVSFTTINFLALDYLLPRLIEQERQLIAELEHDLHSLKEPAARGEVEKILAMKRRHLPQMEALVPSQSKAVLT